MLRGGGNLFNNSLICKLYKSQTRFNFEIVKSIFPFSHSWYAFLLIFKQSATKS